MLAIELGHERVEIEPAGIDRVQLKRRPSKDKLIRGCNRTSKGHGPQDVLVHAARQGAAVAVACKGG